MVTTYLFHADGFVKIGHTADMDGRLFHLIWGGRPDYVTACVGAGELVARYDYETRAEAVASERYAQDLLHDYRLSRRKRGGRCEWFSSPVDVALDAFNKACTAELLTIDVDDQFMRMAEGVKRCMDAASIGDAIRKAVWSEIRLRRARGKTATPSD